MLGVCLGVYVSFIKWMWVTEISEKSPVSHKVCRTVGKEFRLFWIGSFMALNGKLSDIYNNSRFEEVEKSLTGDNEHHVWLYPPTFLLMILPLSLLPYLASLAVWLAITLGSYCIVLRRICPQPLIFFWILFFPGIAINLLVGHNGCLSGTLLGGGLLFIESSPILAGIFFGLFLYKPQLAILIPLALLVGRRWKVLGMTAVAAICMGLASVLILGYEPWLAFWRNIPLSANLTDIPLFWKKMPTIYAAARLAGSGTTIAWMLQGLLMVGVIAGVSWVWSGGATAASRASILVLGILLFTRYAFIYDYAILAIPLAWLWQEGQTAGWLPLEKPVLLCAWFMPLISLMMGGTSYPYSLLILPTALTLFILVLRRHYSELGKAKEAPEVYPI